MVSCEELQFTRLAKQLDRIDLSGTLACIRLDIQYDDHRWAVA
jgi:hypothetical protein